MLVETYEVDELTTDLKVEDKELVQSLCDSLGLEGQKKLINTKTGVRTPFREITVEETFVYNRLLPTITPLADFETEPIPVRVLEMALAVGDQFDTMEVWHRTTPSTKDPLLVGVKDHPDNNWQKTKFILARWGDVLLPFEDLAVMAIASFRKEYGEKIESAAQMFKAAIGSEVSLPETEIIKGTISVPSFYLR